MSPYRILAKYENGEHVILAAMLSVDKLTNYHTIYIIAKTIPSDDSTILTHKDVAHIITTKSNSLILDSYKINRVLELGQKYKVIHEGSGTSNYELGELEHTQQGCLRIALDDYCSNHNIEILRIL